MDNEGMNKRAKRISSSPSVSSMVGNDGDDDRILKLPDTLILHILSFLPTEEVVRTCILSKRWKLIWYSVPTIFFSNNVNLSSTMDTAKLMEWEHGLEKFYNYVDKYLEHRKKAENKVTEMYLCIGQAYITGHHFMGPFYCIPKINARYLTILELNWVQLDASHFNFPSLKTLSMETVKNSDIVEHGEAFKFLLGCPSLEKLQVQNYFFLRSDEMALRLQSLSLKFLELKDTVYDELQVEAINLESLVLCGSSVHNINLSACKKIRNLSFYDTSYHCKPSLNALISQIPLLENLTLVTKEKYKDHVKISVNN
uniref:F-box domain-containing protein n=1 Tax=Cannabis sativa TaxID=3483 RepID=A0A803PZR3_CANSA